MTLKQWLRRERRPEYSGINARQTLRAMVPAVPRSHAIFHAGIAIRDRKTRNIFMSAARESDFG